jgi:hypothetical protein
MKPSAIRAHFLKYLYLLTLAAFIGTVTGNASAQNLYRTDSGEHFSVSLRPAKERVLLDEPTSLILEVRNLSNTKLSLRTDGRPPSDPAGYSITVTQSDGTPVPQIHVGISLGEDVREILLEPGETYHRNFSRPGAVWVTSPGLYQITIEGKLPIGNADRKFKGPISVAATTSLEILAPDPERLGEIINELEAQLLFGDSATSQAAASRLGAFHDPRTSGAFLRFLTTCGAKAKAGGELPEEVKSIASRFLIYLVLRDEAEIGTVVRELKSNPSDFIRSMLSTLLCIRNTPDKFLLLGEMSKDPLPSVRKLAALALRNVSTPETEHTLLEMLNDENEEVREAARKSLNARKSDTPKSVQ